jgi:hypothetical protein
MLFAMPSEFVVQVRNDSSIKFCCPQGHSQYYLDDRLKTLEAKLQKQREENIRLDTERRNAVLERDHHWIERKKTNTRLRHLKERVKHGVCPCCHRQFQNVKEHMALKHPDFAAAEAKPA